MLHLRADCKQSVAWQAGHVSEPEAEPGFFIRDYTPKAR